MVELDLQQIRQLFDELLWTFDSRERVEVGNELMVSKNSIIKFEALNVRRLRMEISEIRQL